MPRGIRFALPVALQRGHVMVFVPSLVNLGEFLIAGNGLFVLVGVRFARRIRAALHEIEAEFTEAIGDLRVAPRTGPVTCELWLYSRYGTLRYFRVNDGSITELDPFGLPLNSGKPATAAGPAGTEREPAPGTPALTAETAAGPLDERGPILRYLKKWNAARLAGRKVWEMESSELRTILNEGGTGGKKGRVRDRKPALGDPTPSVGSGMPRENGGIQG
jgi:hypothetical protein